MRYTIEPTNKGKDRRVWATINRLKNEGLITIVEKGDPLENIKENLRRIARSMQLLEKVGIDEDVMVAFLHDKSKVSKTNIKAVLKEQTAFFKRLGVELK